MDIITLATGEPDFDTPDRTRLAGIRTISQGRTHYAESRGLAALREAIAARLREEKGIACTAANILLAPGGKYAIYETVCTLIDPGESQEVMILNPGWVSYAPIATAAGAVPVGVELSFVDNYRITREALERAVSPNTRLLILNYPNNPTSCILSREEAECVADFIVDHNLLALADEVYSAIIYDGAESVSLASIPRAADRFITINGFSKSAAMTGWRLGYLCAPGEITDMVQMLNQHTISYLSEFSMLAALEALQCGDALSAMVDSYRARRDFFVPALNAIPGVTCHMPKGAFYCLGQSGSGRKDQL
ncbi:aminotransferase class I/II-fold pyridoxal phosphate-dependent enzyme [uncultured Oscillibacter sp.]|uniref:aminotransferase class I/II-fold pyridoxal phosphate-dependent enzyme n=1 Tax=uncultured Oscillibacter sp. TaxID=876091 RepID=UPI00261A51FA|nr:aminotransferase class I/II-fold pyridoxal phosphate-dependent enzyme [uncultured Oscillibacter sp.]